MDIQEIFSQRLKNARLMRGYSLQELQQRINNCVSVQTLSNYEKGKSFPNSEVMGLLLQALDVKIDALFRQDNIDWNNVHFSFRKKSSNFLKSEEEKTMALIKDMAEKYIEIETLLAISSNCNIRDICQQNVVANNEEARDIARCVRRYFKLQEEPILSIHELLETNGIKILSVAANKKFDGVNFVCNEHFFIVHNSDNQAERIRFTIAHELGHLLLNIAKDKDEEKLCNVFANELLLPANRLKTILGENRKNISYNELQYIQSIYGISIEAIMYSANEQNIITDKRYQTFHKKKNYLKTIGCDVTKSTYNEAQTTRFEMLVYRALSSEAITTSKAMYFLNKNIEDINQTFYLV